MTRKTRILTVIVSDLVHSRDIPGRQELSRKIPLLIENVSKKYRKEFYAPLIQVRGIDELSGVLKQSNMSYRICRLLNEAIYPNLFRFAIVQGALDIAIDSRDVTKMDGTAFHTAADMIKQAKKKNLYYCFDLGHDFTQLNLLLNELPNLVHILRSSWSKHQRLVVQFYEKFSTQKAVAKQLGITQQAVSDALRQAHWKELKQAEDIIDQVLKESFSNK